MTLEQLKKICRSLKAVEEKMPFDDQVLVFMVRGKMFCLTDIVDYQFINLKCDPDEAMIFREIYPEVTAGYHMNKRHWISVYDHDDIIRELIEDLIQNSYELVVTKLKKFDRQRIEIIKSLAH